MNINPTEKITINKGDLINLYNRCLNDKITADQVIDDILEWLAEMGIPPEYNGN